MFPPDRFFLHSSQTQTMSIEFDVFDIVEQFSSQSTMNHHTMTLQMRRAKSRQYFTIHKGQQLLTEPYKYNIRLLSPNALDLHAGMLFIELRLVQNDSIVPLGLSIEKQIHIRGAPKHSIDFRMHFAVQSRSYNDGLFYLVIRNEQQHVVCTSEHFSIVSRSEIATQNK